ncbi:MAG: hypothetical protein MOB07_14765 [Acidobacteria bacterium]|nr:hypothetical protein [Acidobacteriota bacterium]
MKQSIARCYRSRQLWGTQTIYPGKDRIELVTNGSNFIRGHDPETGKELWRLGVDDGINRQDAKNAKSEDRRWKIEDCYE